jgi:adenylosuccinate synthase
MPLLRYAIAACGGVDALAVTHVDRVTPEFRIAKSYEDFVPALGPFRDLDYQLSLGKHVSRARPVYEQTSDIVASIEAELGARVAIASHGPRASDKRRL